MAAARYAGAVVERLRPVDNRAGLHGVAEPARRDVAPKVSVKPVADLTSGVPGKPKGIHLEYSMTIILADGRAGGLVTTYRI